MSFRNKKPNIHPTVFVAPGAHIIGDVRIGKNASVWFGAVLRGDIHVIRVGSGANIQDGCVLHVDGDKPCVLGNGVIMGHQSTAHACLVEDGVLIGIGARILSGARIGAFSLIAAGSLVKENAVIPPRSLVVGVPGRVVRKLSEKQAAAHIAWAERYNKLADVYKKYLG
jgi:carbonic anhydrase/acetyltransferase-like protein (isoleucine patch superfamily)